ncbi:MAG: bifunctional (p)ppGpp synthetase/guanosine-3',5'-bis(diphosphate) 3'-pyrophosphohydrolase [Eubacterium sp.]|nr:bifunctional (p)ppGpp synthetase/guanosine-3',5'-bis(diphosphate) 3'-pyrophosphohydrolase [Eubacterium sp.]
MSEDKLNNKSTDDINNDIENQERIPISRIINDAAKTGELATPEDFTNPEDIYKVLIDKIKTYHPSDDFSEIEKAYRIADEAHKDQKRKSGEPYIIHPLCVAIILAELEMDKETIVAGILHDVIEDTKYSKEDIEKLFSPEIALLVDGVTKLTKLNLSQDKIEIQAENLRKMFLAMAKDIRVIIIKLADRLHNLRTLQYQTAAKQIEKARETMDIYAPIANRLGISKVQVEMDDLCMQYLYPDVYEKLRSEIGERLSERENFISDMITEVTEYIKEAEIEAEIEGRVKHLFSIYKKMKTQGKTLDQIYDIFALRIKVASVRDCYAALGIIHAKYKPIPGRFKDYIAMPKSNMYQSLHTTLIGHGGKPFEIQIRTFDMHRTAEYGIAAHWKYKESGVSNVTNDEEKLNWLREILEWQSDTKDNREFMNFVKSDLNMFQDQVYCFTPAGDVIILPKGSNTIDFAYAIHTAVGNQMVGARINGRQVPIETVLHSGDRIEITTSANSRGPSMDWLSMVKSTQAKTKINQWFRQELKEENIARGKSAVDNYCKTKNINLSELLKPEYMSATLKRYNYTEWDSLMAAIGHGGLKEGQIVNRLLEEKRQELEKRKEKDDNAIADEINKKSRTFHTPKCSVRIKGVEDVQVRISKCCSPVPGDDIVGFITRGRGVAIHRTDCENLLKMSDNERERLIDAEWNYGSDNNEAEFIADINVYAMDRNALLYDISRIFMEAEVPIKKIEGRTNKQGKSTVNVQFGVKSKAELASLISKIRNIEGIVDIERTQG